MCKYTVNHGSLHTPYEFNFRKTVVVPIVCDILLYP